MEHKASTSTDTNSQRFWLVGASHGIGKSLAIQLLKNGHRLALSSRNACKDLQELVNQYPNQAIAIDVDVCDAQAIEVSCKAAWEAFSGLDYWFYNAAIYEKSELNKNNSPLFEQCMQINYQGFIRMAHELLPYFEQQHSGRWLVNGSISAHFGLPLGGAYSASKAALLNVCQSLQPELKQRGINLQVINHGFVKTRLTAKNDFQMPFLLSSEATAERIKRFMLTPAHRFELKFPWQMRLIFSLLNLLPSHIALKLTKKLLPELKHGTHSEKITHET